MPGAGLPQLPQHQQALICRRMGACWTWTHTTGICWPMQVTWLRLACLRAAHVGVETRGSCAILQAALINNGGCMVSHMWAMLPARHLQACGPALQLSPMGNDSKSSHGGAAAAPPAAAAAAAHAGPAQEETDPPKIRVVVRKRPINKKV